MLREYALSIVVHVLAFGVRCHDRREKFPETLRNERTPYGYERIRDIVCDDYLARERERHDTGRRIHSSRYAIDEDYRVYPCPSCFVNLGRIKALESSIFMRANLVCRHGRI